MIFIKDFKEYNFTSNKLLKLYEYYYNEHHIFHNIRQRDMNIKQHKCNTIHDAWISTKSFRGMFSEYNEYNEINMHTMI